MKLETHGIQSDWMDDERILTVFREAQRQRDLEDWCWRCFNATGACIACLAGVAFCIVVYLELWRGGVALWHWIR